MCSRYVRSVLCIVFSITAFFCDRVFASDHVTLPIGASAPDFALKGVDGKMYSLASFKKARVLVIIFTCNHCPTAQSYEDRMIQLTADYAAKNVAVVAIMPNDPNALRLDELDFSDLGDSYDDMKTRAAEKHFNFPYLYDGDAEAAAKVYGPVATPHVFIFDSYRKLRYCGRFDDTESHDKVPHTHDARDAIESLLIGKEVSESSTKVFGCSIKWSDKRSLVKESLDKWAAEPVKIDTINETGVKELLQNHSDKLRLINVWATWCGPCTKEFPEFITMYRMYRDRDFEFISISADEGNKQPKALKFLQAQAASNENYIFTGENKYSLIEAVDPKWQGALPYTILVEPGGRIVYSKEGPIDPAELKKIIVENHLIGRYP
jgi:peroxiredoxin